MNAHGETAPNFETFRSYLMLLARIHLRDNPRERLEPSDIVQQTLFEAHAHAEKLPRAQSELMAWLRTALANNIRDARRHQRRKKRDVGRVRSLESDLDASYDRNVGNLVASQSSPSRIAVRNEEILVLADCLCKLPAAQQDAIVLHHLQQWSLDETARRLGKSEAAVAGLLHRGLRKLRKLMVDTQDPEIP